MAMPPALLSAGADAAKERAFITFSFMLYATGARAATPIRDASERVLGAYRSLLIAILEGWGRGRCAAYRRRSAHPAHVMGTNFPRFLQFRVHNSRAFRAPHSRTEHTHTARARTQQQRARRRCEARAVP
jgi:hypothetical protein